MRIAALVLLYAAILGAADEAEVPNGIRLATRLSDGRVFIQGGEGKTEVVITKPEILPVDAGLRGGFEHVTPEYIAKFQTDHPTKWHSGDKWKVYTGGGAPLTVVIQDLVMVQPYLGNN